MPAEQEMSDKQEMRFSSLGQEDPLEKEMSTHSSICAWEIPWTEGPGRLQSMELQRAVHDLVTKQQQQILLIELPFTVRNDLMWIVSYRSLRL